MANMEFQDINIRQVCERIFVSVTTLAINKQKGGSLHYLDQYSRWPVTSREEGV